MCLFIFFLVCTGNRSCYTCSSRNGSEAACEDPFHPGLDENQYYEDKCKVGKEGHIGLFPGLFCVKVKGIVGKLATFKLS